METITTKQINESATMSLDRYDELRENEKKMIFFKKYLEVNYYDIYFAMIKSYHGEK